MCGMTMPAEYVATTTVRLKRLGIDTYQEAVVYLPADAPVCQSEGWQAEARVLLSLRDRSIAATLNVTTNGLLEANEASLSDAAWRLLDAREGDLIHLSNAPPLASMSHVRARAYHEHLDPDAITAIVRDIAAGSYSVRPTRTNCALPVARAAPVVPSPVATRKTSAGMPAASASSRTSSALSGEASEGLSTTVLPQTSAARTERMQLSTGKFHGPITPTTP